MGILDTILGAGGGRGKQVIADQLGLSSEQVGAALGQLLPALNAGVRRNTEKSGGLDALTGALSGGGHGRYVDEPDLLKESKTIDDGNAILGHVFGSKDVSRQVAAQASAKTGLDVGILKKMLPMAASMMMGSLSKNQGKFTEGGKASGSLLGSLLDADGDGSMADDVMGMLKKLF